MTEHTNGMPHWDLTNVYPSLDSAEFKTGNEQIVTMLDDVDGYMAEHKIGSDAHVDTDPKVLNEIISGMIDMQNEAHKTAGTMGAYIYSFITTDSRNDDAAKALSVLEQQNVRLQQSGVIFQAWMGKLADKVPAILEHGGVAAEHKFALEEMVESAKYMMSNDEEMLAAELDLSGANAWGKLQGTITSQLSWEIEDEDGNAKKLPMTAIINLRSDPSEVMRRRGYEAEMAAWKSVETQLAACMNGVKGSVNTLNKHRGRKDAVHSSLDASRIDRETLEAMLGAMEDSFPMFERYFKVKAKKLGKEKLPWWDLFAPLGKTDRIFSWEEAKQSTLDNFGKFSPDLAAYAKKAFDNNWMDVPPREGKRAGAFCMGIPALEESRILLNFDGSLDSLSTLAHELGHGFHNECLRGKTEINSNTPMTLAETASIMCEAIVTDAAIAAAQSPEEELGILEAALTGDSQVVVDIYSRYLFETEVFETRDKGELSADELSEIMERAQAKTYGEGLDPEYRQKYMWTWKPHYYYAGLSFYNYPYTFGLLFATGLYAIYKERGDEFVEQYKELLGSTGLGTAAELAARFDIDIRKKEFWAGSLKLIGKRIDRYEQL